jgi:hypothetical protein
MQDLCEPIELLEFELDAVAGGNPFSIPATVSVSAISSTVSVALSTAFSNSPAAALTAAIDQSVTITGP